MLAANREPDILNRELAPNGTLTSLMELLDLLDLDIEFREDIKV